MFVAKAPDASDVSTQVSVETPVLYVPLKYPVTTVFCTVEPNVFQLIPLLYSKRPPLDVLYLMAPAPAAAAVLDVVPTPKNPNPGSVVLAGFDLTSKVALGVLPPIPTLPER